jgi:hypothetical protein
MSLPKTFTAGERLFASDLNDNFNYLNAGFRFAGTRYFTSSGTFVKADPLGTGDIGLRAIRVTCWGGGGSGGGIPSGTGVAGGGGGGSAGRRFITDIALLSASVNVAVGAAGSGGTGNGSTGGDSTFDSTVVVGKGGTGGTSSGVAGERTAGSVGDIVFPGGAGGAGGVLGSPAGGGGNGALGIGAGARPDRNNITSSGNPGFGFASGGSGAIRQTDGSEPGGNGANGIVIVDCFV